MKLSAADIARHVAADVADGSYVNLGIGMPMRVADHVPEGREFVLHSENGLLGMGPAPAQDAVDPDIINAGKQPVTILPGGSYFHHADSFAMIRGGHVDVSILGAYEVAANGDIANCFSSSRFSRNASIGVWTCCGFLTCGTAGRFTG